MEAMRNWSWLLAAGILASGGFFVFGDRTVEIERAANFEPEVLEEVAQPPRADGDLPYQAQLANPPSEVRALYVTNWVAATPSLMSKVVKVVEETNVNALVIDIKDYSGYVGFNTDNQQIIDYGAREIRIRNLNRLIKELHDKDIYLIGRVTIFQDPRLALARPDLAVKNAAGEVWKDRKGLSWMDPAAREVWDYNIALAREITERGFDEVNFDYIRFPSDGSGLSGLQFPFWDQKGERHEVIRDFFAYLREELSGVKISADIFGQTTVTAGGDDQGIGQLLEDAYDYFDYVAPMVYPSHFINGFIGIDNPGAEPYRVIKYSMASAIDKLEEYELEKKTAALPPMVSTATTTATSTLAEAPTATLSLQEKKEIREKIRPWLQDFDLGAVYTVEMVKTQMQAVQDAGLPDSWMIWNPANRYREAIFEIDTEAGILPEND